MEIVNSGCRALVLFEIDLHQVPPGQTEGEQLPWRFPVSKGSPAQATKRRDDLMPATALRETPLHACHVAAGASLVPFAGWLMPLRYGSELAEHRAVREAAGILRSLAYG